MFPILLKIGPVSIHTYGFMMALGVALGLWFVYVQAKRQGLDAPKLLDYKPQPELIWESVEDRLNFELFEKGFTLAEAVEEARRCLCCGPCKSCKGCVVLEFQTEIAEIELDQDLCSGCGVCIAVCPFEAIRLEKSDENLVAIIDENKCKRCGLCRAACPAGAITIKDGFVETIANAYESL